MNEHPDEDLSDRVEEVQSQEYDHWNLGYTTLGEVTYIIRTRHKEGIREW